MLGKIRIRWASPGTVPGRLSLIVATSGVVVAAIAGHGTVSARISKDGKVTLIGAEADKRCQGSQ